MSSRGTVVFHVIENRLVRWFTKQIHSGTENFEFDKMLLSKIRMHQITDF